MFYNRENKPINPKEWAELLELPGYKRVARTEFQNGWTVSTVWIGLSVAPFGRPLIFETMVFDNEGPRNKRQYFTEAEALKGHKEAVTIIEKELRKLHGKRRD